VYKKTTNGASNHNDLELLARIFRDGKASTTGLPVSYKTIPADTTSQATCEAFVTFVRWTRMRRLKTLLLLAEKSDP
jgi:hypothetical protein